MAHEAADGMAGGRIRHLPEAGVVLVVADAAFVLLDAVLADEFARHQVAPDGSAVLDASAAAHQVAGGVVAQAHVTGVAVVKPLLLLARAAGVVADLGGELAGGVVAQALAQLADLLTRVGDAVVDQLGDVFVDLPRA